MTAIFAQAADPAPMNWPQAFAVVGVVFGFAALAWALVYAVVNRD